MGRLQATASVGDPLKLSEINAQFDATGQSLRAFLRNGTYVKSSDINSGSVGATVPTTSTLKMSDLLGKSEVYITNHGVSISSGGLTVNTATVSVRLRSDGTFTWASTTTGGDDPTSNSGTYTGEWLPGNKNSGDYSVQAIWTPDPANTGGTFTGTTGSGVWSVLSTFQEWSLQTSSNGTNERVADGILSLSIRNNSDSVILDTASITMHAASIGTA